MEAQPECTDAHTQSWNEVSIENLTPPKPFLMQFQQQRLPTFFLAPTITFTLGVLAVSWICCGSLAAIFITQNKRFKSHTVRYDDVNKYTFPVGAAQSDPTLLSSFTVSTPSGPITTSQGRKTTVSFTLSETIPGPVTMFYILEPFYQNFRNFVESGSDSQLLGNDVKKGDLYLCSPFRSPGEYYKKGSERINDAITVNGIAASFSDLVYNPCGAKAWSMFNDTVILEERHAGGAVKLRCDSSDFNAEGERLVLDAASNPCAKSDITWSADKKRFKPSAKGPFVWSANYPFSTDNDFLQKGWYFNEAGHSLPNPMDKDLISWLAISATSGTRKVWRILEGDMRSHDDNGDVIEYTLNINEFYPTHEMGVEKKIMFLGSEGSDWLQAPNTQFVYPLVTVAGFSFFFFVIILAGCIISRRRQVRDDSQQIHSVHPASFRTQPSKTLEESLEPDSFESGQYVELCVRRQLNWERQKREAERYAQYSRAQESSL